MKLLFIFLLAFGIFTCGSDDKSEDNPTSPLATDMVSTQPDTPTVTMNDPVDDLMDESSGIESIGQAQFTGDNNYNVSGSAEIFYDTSADSYSLVLSNFNSDNGPRLEVYLATDDNATSFKSLGDLKSTNGTMRYDFSSSDFDSSNTHVLIWCSAFSQNFGTAVLPFQ